jgi:hypothetical protein
MLGFQDPPLTAGMDVSSTIVDAIADYYRLFSDDVGTLSTQVTTLLATLYDTYEGQSIAVADKLGHSFILPKVSGVAKIKWALVNSFSEIPPLGCFPARKRDTNWDALGDYAQVIYDLCKEYRYVVSNARANARLTTPAGVGLGATISGIPSNWSVYQFAPALNNSETRSYHIFTQTNIGLATVRPWHGFYLNWNPTSFTGKLITCHERNDLDQVYGYATTSNIGKLKVQDAAGVIVYLPADKPNLTQPCSAYFNNKSYIGYLADDALSIKIYELSYPNYNLIMSYSTSNASSPSLCAYPDGTVLLYWIEGGKPYVQQFDSSFTAIGTKQMTNLVDKSSVDALITVTAAGAINVKLACIDINGVLDIFTSSDTVNFS